MQYLVQVIKTWLIVEFIFFILKPNSKLLFPKQFQNSYVRLFQSFSGQFFFCKTREFALAFLLHKSQYSSPWYNKGWTLTHLVQFPDVAFP